MYRQTNNENGFQVRNDNEMGYLSNDKYPAQNEDYLGNVICLNVKVQDTQELITRFKVPESKDYQDYLYRKNSGIIDFFEILRYDMEEPFRAILMDRFGRVISTYTTEIEQMYDLIPSYMYNDCIKRAHKAGFNYIAINTTEDKDLFFEKYQEEKIHIYQVQDQTLLGIEVYSEYDTDMLTLDHTHNIVDKREKYEFTPEMKATMLKRNNKLFGLPDEIYKSYPNYYNIHAKSYVDDPIRAINKGYIIRADQNSQVEPELVVMEILEDGTTRFVTQHEARFYYNTDNMVNRNVRDIVNGIITPVEPPEVPVIIEPELTYLDFLEETSEFIRTNLYMFDCSEISVSSDESIEADLLFDCEEIVFGPGEYLDFGEILETDPEDTTVTFEFFCNEITKTSDDSGKDVDEEFDGEEEQHKKYIPEELLIDEENYS